MMRIRGAYSIKFYTLVICRLRMRTPLQIEAVLPATAHQLWRPQWMPRWR